MLKKLKNIHFSFVLFVFSTIFLIFSYGVVVGKYKVFPHGFIEQAQKGYKRFRRDVGWDKSIPWFFQEVENRPLAPFKRDQAYPGLNLITKIDFNKDLYVQILDMDLRKVHEWRVDWFEIWPGAKHVPEGQTPVEKPGTHIHGAVVLENGDLVFNFEHCGMIRMDPNGKVVWRSNFQTHHSIHRNDDGHLWVCGQRSHVKRDPRFPHRTPHFVEYLIFELTPDSQIVEQWSVPELLIENGYHGLLHLGNLHNWTTVPAPDADLLHLNDVEPFPSSMKEDFFEHGDVMVSLRNINTIFVFNRKTRKIKFICTGWFVRQHDPDFIDGNRFSVFDNNNVGPESFGQQSRIVIVSARERTRRVFFEGAPSVKFYTDIMGKHQWLPNGNLLLTESAKGRAFEINPQGEILWEYINYIGPGLVGLVEEAQRLPLGYEKIYGHSR